MFARMTLFWFLQAMLTNMSHVFLRVCPPSTIAGLDLVDRQNADTFVDFVGQQIALCTLVLDTLVQPLTQSLALSTETW